MHNEKELKKEVIEMIEMVDSSQTGLLNLFKMKIIDIQAEYYYSQCMKFDRQQRLLNKTIK